MAASFSLYVVVGQTADGALIFAPVGTGATGSAPIPISGDVTLDVGDVEIGEVVLKDGSSSNTATISSAGRLSVDGSGVTQPISASALPLPTLAATSTNQATIISTLGNINTNVTGVSTAARQDTGNASLAAIQASVAGTLNISGAVVATLDTTDANNLASIVTNTNNVSTATKQDTGNASLATIATVLSSPLAVTGTFYQPTQPISAASLPLPTNAAQENGGNLAISVKLLSDLLYAKRAGNQIMAAQNNMFIPTPEIFQLGAP